MIAKIAKPAVFAVASLACFATVLPTVATAQSYGPAPVYGQPTYDPCVREQRQRQASAGLLGAAIGAVAGSQIANRGNRTEGSILGGVVGAAIGAGVGGSSAACTPGAQVPMPIEVYDSPPPPPPPVYKRRYSDGYPARDRGYDYYEDYPADLNRGAPAPAQRDECQLAESQIRLPDGRVETRYVRTCPDERGRYRVVD